MPATTFSHTASTTASVEAAWIALQDPQTWSSIGPVSNVSDPAHTDDGILASFKWAADVGGKAYPGVAKMTANVPNERYELTMDTSEIAGDVVTTLVPANPGCVVTVQITFRTKGMLSAMFFPAIKQTLSTGFPQQIEDLVAAI